MTSILPIRPETGASQRAAASAAQYGLVQLGGRPPLGKYLSELWSRRHLTWEFAKSRFRAQNEANRLGMGWVVLNPLIQAGVYGLVFGLIMPNSSRPENYPAFLVVGVFTFSFFSGCFADGAKSLISNRGMVRALHFPRAVLPLATVLQKMFELVAMVAVMAIIVMFTGETPDLDWLMIIPAYALMALFCGGVAFLAARLTVHMRDITQLIPFITRLFFYMSGIFFIIGERFKDRAFGPLLELNPLNVYISLIRYSMLEGLRGVENGIEITATTWALAGGYGVLLFVVGFLFFWQAEGLYGRD
ncbi:ABC transporter permease [Kineosporia rhizophila]|uniref:ABC transporter permease n=1 Tax=Kineosporia TaxID=49184 RepID=UPI001E4575EA|nr:MULTISPECIES: ABC transporter permease [Kineosporia]MCE0534897.1 ABC transporter permease [Kineosporia rhizophila]GLY14823.1 transport permease protein [Kineosporia sp. NBRC 101677]